MTSLGQQWVVPLARKTVQNLLEELPSLREPMIFNASVAVGITDVVIESVRSMAAQDHRASPNRILPLAFASGPLVCGVIILKFDIPIPSAIVELPSSRS